MTTTVWKYALDVGRTVIDVPAGAEILCVQTDAASQRPCIWMRVETKMHLEKRAFVIVGTGHVAPSFSRPYVGTCQMMVSGCNLVWHVFEDLL